MSGTFDRTIPYEARNAQRPSAMAYPRYQPFAPIALPDRTWPSTVITAGARAGAPSTCATATRP